MVAAERRSTEQIRMLFEETVESADADSGRTPQQMVDILDDLAEEMIGRKGPGDAELSHRITAACEMQNRKAQIANDKPRPTSQ
jgi:hypothetical protein